MSTVTDRLLADMIAHHHYPDGGQAKLRDKYAAERLALAEQQSEPAVPPTADWIVDARERAHTAAAEVYAGIGGAAACYGLTARGQEARSLISAALDAFIAAMPRSPVTDEMAAVLRDELQQVGLRPELSRCRQLLEAAVAAAPKGTI